MNNPNDRFEQPERWYAEAAEALATGFVWGCALLALGIGFAGYFISK